MRPTRATALLTAGLVTLLGAPAGAAAAAGAPADLYVNNQDGSNCSDTGAGTQAVPYCTISAAAKVVAPGQTVRIRPGRMYDEAVTITRSGEPNKPIGFVADAQPNANAYVQLANGRALTVSGASHVVLNKLITRSGLQIKGSSDVVLDQVYSRNGSLDSLAIGEGSSDVRVSRASLIGVRVDGGSRNTVFSRNQISGTFGPAIAAVDAPGTVITNNTLTGHCAATVSVTGGSTASGLYNNVLITGGDPGNCPVPDARNAVLVSKSAAAGTLADYNAVGADPKLYPAPYSWSGVTYKDVKAFQAATGQGAHDVSAESADKVSGYEGSLSVDSADATAPGVLLTDFSGKAMVDDPLVPNTGKNGGYLDRGATELQDWLSSVSLIVDQPHAPVGTEVAVQAASNSRWPTSITYKVDFGDGSAPVDAPRGVGDNGIAKHTYTKPGDYVVKVTAVNPAGEKASTEKPVKAAPAGPGTAAFTATQVLPPAGDTEAHVAPLTYAFDASSSVTQWPVARMEVDFGEGWYQGYEGTTSAQHTYERPGDYKATVKLVDTKGGTATTTRTVRVDYAPSGYVAVTPYRVQDTRTWGGFLKGGEPTVVAMPLDLKTGYSTAAGMSAVVLNVTLTEATQDTHLSVSPTREDRPATSNVNVRKGGTTSNTVTVPVDEHGWVWMRLNAGQAAMIVDFVGYYQPNAGEKFSPVAPTRLADTRTAGGALAGGSTRTVKVAGVNGIPVDAKAVAVNLTSTAATSDTYVIAYPDPAKRPVASNLNPEPGKDKSNQAVLPVGPNGTITLYNNAGSTHLIVDAVGYYGGDGSKALFTPAAPRRLADTRTTGKLAPGATTTVSGLPAGAIGAVLNLTATETTGAGYLTAYGFGSARPEASSLNTLPGLTVPNHVMTPVGDGKVSVFNSWGGSNHVITDLLGYFTQG
ncbi:PKD domain-containing protein [Streptomyces sp. NPDC085524]|uniref:PKD domain-containing protein n=1 Tax=Streptomyces sp. NPDC085524 TaxID=3365728 RepID=UPI0037D2E414